MASQDFPNTIATAATVATAAYATSAAAHAPPPQPPSSKPTVTIHFDRSYLRTLPGILKIAQLELGYCAVWAVFYFIGAIIMAVKGKMDDAWAAAAFFGFVGTGLYGFDAFLKFKAWRSGEVAQGDTKMPSAMSPTSPMSPTYTAY